MIVKFLQGCTIENSVYAAGDTVDFKRRLTVDLTGLIAAGVCEKIKDDADVLHVDARVPQDL